MRFKHVKKGDDFNVIAADHNDWQDTAREHVNRNKHGGLPANHSFNFSSVRIQNNTGKDLGRFSVVELDGFSVSPETNQGSFYLNATFKAQEPSNKEKLLAITLEPIKDTSVGSALIHGIAQVKVETEREVSEYVGYDIDSHSTDHLIFDGPGQAKILALQDDSQAKNDMVWATVMLTPWDVSAREKLDEELFPNGTALTESGRTVTDYMMKAGQSIPAFTQVTTKCLNGTWYVTNASCE